MNNINPIYLEEVNRDFWYRLSKKNAKDTSLAGLMAGATGLFPTMATISHSVNPDPITGSAITALGGMVLAGSNALGREAPRIAQDVRVNRLAGNIVKGKNGLHADSESIKRFARKFRINSDKDKLVFKLEKALEQGESIDELTYIVNRYRDQLNFKQLKDAIYKSNIGKDVKNHLLKYINVKCR